MTTTTTTKPRFSSLETKIGSENSTRTVWFPEDADGEPHPSNPDNGCGGGIFKLETFHDIDSPWVLMKEQYPSRTTRDATKSFVLGSGWQQTMDLVHREWQMPITRGGCGGQWQVLEDKLMAIDEPYWAAVGELWGYLHGNAPRLEEQMEESTEMKNSESGDDGDKSTDDENEDYDSEESTDEDCWSRSSSGTGVTTESTLPRPSSRSRPAGAGVCTCSCPAISETHDVHCACKCAECVDYGDESE